MSAKILTIDDQKDIVRLADILLRYLEYESYTLTDSRQAIDMIQKIKPNLVLLDLQMPHLSGYDICEAIKEDDQFNNLKIVIFTASPSSEVLTRGKALGADDVLQKPFTIKDLRNVLDKHL